MKMEKKLVEEWLPLSALNKNAKKEMGFIRVPKISNMHTWLARRPTCSARVLTLASILPCNETVKAIFNNLLGFNIISEMPYELLYLVNPDRRIVKKLLEAQCGKKPEKIVVVDPMAGGGSIPLESLRLGFKTVAIEYNPIAYTILKATLEYPAKYGEKLSEDVKREALALIDFSKNELGKYYAEDAQNYIIARGFRCTNPECNGLVPIVHGTKIGKNGPYIKFEFNRETKKFKIKVVAEESTFERLKCPYCGSSATRPKGCRRTVSMGLRKLRLCTACNRRFTVGNAVKKT